MNELEGSRMFVNLSRHSTRSPVARQQTIASSVARQVWNGLRMDDAPGTNLAAVVLNLYRCHVKIVPGVKIVPA